MKTFRSIIILFITMIMAVTCNSQQGTSETCIDREAVVAGQFYPSNPDALKTVLGSYFGMVDEYDLTGQVQAIIVPHAGYPYSGQVAASGYSVIDTDREYKNIFVIAASHRVVFDGASIYNQGDYVTPLGKVKVNRELATKIIDESPYFSFTRDAHTSEHSLEVQLPFLQYIFDNNIQVVPIVTGTQNIQDCRNLANVLKPYFTPENLFVISSDFSHYPNYDDAVVADKNMADAILKNSPRIFRNAINENNSKDFENLVTSCCGWPAVMTLLYITEELKNLTITHLDYQNSGDVSRDKSRVVGYNSFAISIQGKNKNMSDEFQLTPDEKKMLLEIARNTISTYLQDDHVPDVDTRSLTKTLQDQYGAFVTLHIDGALRGCIGRFDATEPLYSIVQKMAVSAATGDPRFSPVEMDDLSEIDIEISVLTPMKKISSIDEIILGKHGIYIKKGYSSGTFLPQVATDTRWSKEEFLGHCARDKARIGWNGWKDADIYTYEAYVFGEEEIEK